MRISTAKPDQGGTGLQFDIRLPFYIKWLTGIHFRFANLTSEEINTKINYCFFIENQFDLFYSSISPYVAHLLVNRKQVTVGTIGGDYELFSRQPGPTEVEEAIYCKVMWC